jgi:hypothetical protein
MIWWGVWVERDSGSAWESRHSLDFRPWKGTESMARARASNPLSGGKKREARPIDQKMWEDPDDQGAWIYGDGRRKGAFEEGGHTALGLKAIPEEMTASSGLGASGPSGPSAEAKGANGPGESFEAVKELRYNSWEWEALYPQMDDEAFLTEVEHSLKNCAWHSRPCTTYDETVIEIFAPELVRRLRAAVDVRRKLEFEWEILQKRFGAVLRDSHGDGPGIRQER